MLHSFYLMQGVFFQDREWLGLDTKPLEGVVAVINRGLCRHTFSGVLVRSPDGVFEGTTNDSFGEAELSEIYFSETDLRFIKQYIQRRDTILYSFTKQADGTWTGAYRGCSAVGTGSCRCIITPVPSSFFDPPRI